MKRGKVSAGAAGQLRRLGRLLVGLPLGEPGLDWQAVVDLAQRHGVSPLLFWRLKEQQALEALVPMAVHEALRASFHVAAARSLLAERQLAQVAGALAGAGVPAMVVKGPAEAAFYPDPALRTYGDLDLLVPREQLMRAEAALNELGYRCSRLWTQALLEHVRHLPRMVTKDGRLPVEVHWRLDRSNRPGRLPSEDLWARAVPWSVGGQATLRLEVVDAALEVCWHAVVGHRMKLGVRPLCDLTQLTGGWSQTDWEALIRRAVDYELGRVVYLMLNLMDRVLGQPAPPEVMDALRPFGGELLQSGTIERFLRLLESRRETNVPAAVARAWATGTLLVKLQSLLWHLFLPRSCMAIVYNVPPNSPRIWLTYLWRPVDLLGRYGQGAWAALRGDPAARAAWAREAWLERWLNS